MSFVVVFNLVLTVLTAVTGVVWLADKLWLRRLRAAAAAPAGTEAAPPGPLVDFCVSLFPVILAVFVLRSFVVEPFRIPSGSMIPTLHIGDFILINKFDYGLRCPVGECKLVDVGEPKRGDVVVFRYPARSESDPNYGNDFIKRVIGVPGDRIQYSDRVLTVNGQRVETQPGGMYPDDPMAQLYTEDLTGVRHSILLRPAQPDGPEVDRVVPPGFYFMMGDNRDGSNDSRYWGFVPEQNLKGKAILIWMSWDRGPAFSRFGKLIR